MTKMKVSFSLSKTPSSATTSEVPSVFESSISTNNNSPPKQFITEFDPSPPSSQTLIIPPLPNQFRPFENTRILQNGVTHSQPLQFELDPSSKSVEQAPESISYGLNVMRLNDSNGVSGKEEAMAIKYKEDIRRLPDDFGFKEFEDMPVEGFGAALMAGYGWREGRGIGRNAKEDMKVVQYKSWNGKAGLGFQKEAPQRGENDGKIGDET